MSFLELDLVEEGADTVARLVAGLLVQGEQDESDCWSRRLFIDSTESEGKTLYWITIVAEGEDGEEELCVRTSPEEAIAIGQRMVEWGEAKVRETSQKLPLCRLSTRPRVDTRRARRRGVR